MYKTEAHKRATHKYLRTHRELWRERNRQWRMDNPEKAKKACSNWYKRIPNKIQACLHSRVYESFDGKVKGFLLWEILGYSCADFMTHIESWFHSGMSWDNHGEWEIDHIIPISFFQYDSFADVEFKMCWRLENIQPMWKHEHRCKATKILIA